MTPYYEPATRKEYICGTQDSDGMMKCENFPNYMENGIYCNESASLYSNNTATNHSCVNWNQYYNSCEAKAHNPFFGAISFDNIGLAWVAIFQVYVELELKC